MVLGTVALVALVLLVVLVVTCVLVALVVLVVPVASDLVLCAALVGIVAHCSPMWVWRSCRS